MVDLGFRVDEGLNILLYRKCSKYNFGLRRMSLRRGRPSQQSCRKLRPRSPA